MFMLRDIVREFKKMPDEVLASFITELNIPMFLPYKRVISLIINADFTYFRFLSTTLVHESITPQMLRDIDKNTLSNKYTSAHIGFFDTATTPRPRSARSPEI